MRSLKKKSGKNSKTQVVVLRVTKTTHRTLKNIDWGYKSKFVDFVTTPSSIAKFKRQIKKHAA